MAPKIPKSAIEKLNTITDHKPPSPRGVADTYLRFSFSYWRQEKPYFGLEGATKEWFITLLEKLKDLSDKTVEEFLTNGFLKDAFRIHAISWTSCSITEESFRNFLPLDYRSSEDYEIYQFKITNSKGRVIGFFDEKNSFQVVFLDIAHNMQLSSYNDYEKTVTGELPNSYNKMIGKIHLVRERLAKATKPTEIATLKELLDNILIEEYSAGHFFFLNEMHHEKVNELLAMKEHDELDYLLMEALDHYHKHKIKKE